jgi:hypothetical protein
MPQQNPGPFSHLVAIRLPGTEDRAFLLSGQAIARFGIAVAVWLNAGLLAATALAARLVPDRHRRLADEIRPQRPPLGDRRFADSSLEGGGFELPVPLATERLSCQLHALAGVLFGELGFGLTNHQDREGDGCQHTEAEQHPVEKAGPVS